MSPSQPMPAFRGITGKPLLRWYPDVREFLADATADRPWVDHVESLLGAEDKSYGHCLACARPVDFAVNGGAMMGEHVALREGMVCPACGLSSRARLMLAAIADMGGFEDGKDIALLEAISPLARWLTAKHPRLCTSEYLPHLAPGEIVVLRGVLTRNESLLALSHAEASLDLLVHCDVLEHIEDTDACFSEALRVLKPEGVMLFSAPWFPHRQDTLVRGRTNAEGSIEHLETPEYHGDGVTNQGIYTFYHFGADLLDRITAQGFVDARIGYRHDAFMGLMSNNYRYGDECFMYPTVISARKPPVTPPVAIP